MTRSRKLSLEISEAAAQAIIDQASYYQEQSPDSALNANWEKAVTRTVQSLLSMPERGAECRFQAPTLRGMRRMVIEGFPKHSLFYIFAVREQVVRIVDIVHGARDLDALFSDMIG